VEMKWNDDPGDPGTGKSIMNFEKVEKDNNIVTNSRERSPKKLRIIHRP
jgi:hypothetical protein